MQIWEIVLVIVGVFVFLWLTISALAVIITMIGPPADMHDVTIDDNKGNDAAKSKKLR